MKYLPLTDIDAVANALNFSTPDCHIVGGCDIYTTKAAGTDKKLYRNIEHSLESQYESLVRLSASLSPPYLDPSEDSNNAGKDGARKRHSTVESTGIDLSRASPFGPLSQNGARRTFAYLIATLNAAHPDYDFSHLLRPSDFRKERSLRAVMNHIDTTLQNLRPRHTAATKYLSPPSSAPSGFGLGNEVWNPTMWKALNGQMDLRQCERYSYNPDEDPFDGEEGSIWSMHYFFFNKEKKRVCYLYLRGFSVVSHSPVHAPVSSRHSKPAMHRMVSRSVPNEAGASKRASFWLGDDYATRDVHAVGGDLDDEYDNDELASRPGDDEVDVPFMDLDDLRSDLADGRLNDYAIDDDEDDNYEGSWRLPRHVRAVSEEIGEAMELGE